MSSKYLPVESYISSDQLKDRIRQLGRDISDHYKNDEILVLSVLNGAIMFTADLVRQITSPVNLNFIRASSYKNAKESSGSVEIDLSSVANKIQNSNVLIIEDIVDSGNTYSALLAEVQKYNPNDIKFASLLFKPARLKNKVKIDFLGFEIENKFVIGYGLDYEGLYRELPFVGLYKK